MNDIFFQVLDEIGVDVASQVRDLFFFFFNFLFKEPN